MNVARALLLIGCAFVLAGCTTAVQEGRYRVFFSEIAATLVPDYRLAPETRYGPLWSMFDGVVWETRDGSGRPKSEMWTSGDFNGDRVLDYAYILINAASTERALYAFLSSAQGYVAVALAPDIDTRMGLATRWPGRYQTAAAMGYGRAADDAVQEFNARHDAIEFFQFDGASSTFVWNDATETFDRFQTSH